ncbi:MAG TPA: polysaccharide deacetylase family protein [Solirubrobacterales bacterium]|nr:polysaccharide deacetylase family protein [Solirubrobacterales bacterium]HNG57647.1 polysaccharide deacetylase family protein [Solirubrobacterales bacterium]
MDSGFEARLARRREEVRRRQIVRRRVVLGSMLGVLLAAAVFMLFLRSDDSGESGTQQTAGNNTAGQQGAGTSETSQTSVGTEASRGGAQPDDSWGPHTGPVPILMYHVIGPAAGSEDYPGLFLSTPDFQDQVDWLADNGYTAVTLVQVQNAWYDGGTLPERPVVLSFDDGYLGQYLFAMPILEKEGWAGQLNLKSEGSDLSSKQVKKMYRAGWEIASHSITHPDLTTLDPATLEHELVGSKEELEKDLGFEIVNFCYPAGQYDDEVVKAVEAAGYRGATTVNPGLAEKSMPFELNRIRIDAGDGPDQLATKLVSAGA